MIYLTVDGSDKIDQTVLVGLSNGKQVAVKPHESAA
jgi:hypothetical protein